MTSSHWSGALLPAVSPAHPVSSLVEWPVTSPFHLCAHGLALERSVSTMVNVYTPPRLIQVGLPVSNAEVSAILKVCASMPTPPDRPAMGRGALAAGTCIRAVLAKIDRPDSDLMQLALSLETASAAFEHIGPNAAKELLTGRRSKFPAWERLITLDSHHPESAYLLVGAELILAMLQGRFFRRTIAERCSELLLTIEEGDPGAAVQLANYCTSLIVDVSRALHAERGLGTSREALINHRVASSLRQQIKDPNISDRQGGQTIRCLTALELSAACAAVRRRVGEGNEIALATAVAFSLGLPWDVSLDVLFAHHASDNWVACIDAQEGTTKIDLASVLQGAAKAKPGHEPANQILTRPLPSFASELLAQACSKNPAARCLRDLIPDAEVHSRSRIAGTEGDSAIAPTIARLINSRGPAAIRAGVDRAVAAYAMCDLRQIGKSKNFYLSVGREDIWTATSLVFQTLGWGPTSKGPDRKGLAVGSLVTPAIATMKQLDGVFLSELESNRAGRKYTYESLERYHNAYARFCVHRTAYFTCARRAHTFNFLASDFAEGAEFALLVDKRVGPHAGRTPLPMPSGLAEQVRLWKLHLQSLKRRLVKLNIKLKRKRYLQALQLIDRILSGEAAPLFFTLGAGTPRSIGSAHLEARHGGLELNGDCRRHFVANYLRERTNVPSSYVDAAMRHFTEGISLTRADAGVVGLNMLTQLADALDRMAFSLGLTPMPGFSRS